MLALPAPALVSSVCIAGNSSTVATLAAGTQRPNRTGLSNPRRIEAQRRLPPSKRNTVPTAPQPFRTKPCAKPATPSATTARKSCEDYVVVRKLP
jgi:hypothetical protein